VVVGSAGGEEGEEEEEEEEEAEDKEAEDDEGEDAVCKSMRIRARVCSVGKKEEELEEEKATSRRVKELVNRSVARYPAPCGARWRGPRRA